MSVKKQYLLFYNGISALLWSYILYNCIIDLNNGFFPYSINDTDDSCSLDYDYDINKIVFKCNSTQDIIPHKFIIITQIFNSILELLHSIIGLVPSPIGTLLLQSFARLIIMIGICLVIPESPANYNILIFSSLIFAWSTTEIIRYGFYFLKLKNKQVPYWLIWLRYSAFFILYPLGLISESLTVYNSYDIIRNRLPGYSNFLKFALPLYLPGFLYLYNYMIKQRQKVLRNEQQKLL
ncbi:hypothetical protein KGF54_005667 [Candida jiufengensis]|uniref:uncharacterized protein n=1 Tax=Candida jiufengensis TaxID=497108 RepID=UPI002224D8E1|nr:uncharacterized protein KGF54_005667 [Candida jiufengensis]KAI5949432.1 hypothetical protein KGF54_005667 [Candida jiufengensis]